MAFREVAVSEVREVLRLTALGRGLREIARLTGIDRKTVRRYLEAARDAGFDPAAGVGTLDDALIGAVCERVRPARPGGHGRPWAALEERRAHFRSLGAVATDHGAETAYTGRLAPSEADAILGRALRGEASAADARRFTGHLLMELARMSVDDGLVMQLHVGSFRDHDAAVFERFGPDMGADIPVAAELTRNLRPLLDLFGNDPRLRLILFTLDETVYSRELAPLAGHYPALRIGPPWWFHDSPNGIARYLDAVTETAGIHNLSGFADDTRAFCSIPARHDVWRRASANWLAGLVVRHVVDEAAASEMAAELASGLAKQAYRLDGAA